ncbi:NnrS family protein [Sulfurimonas sp. SAG-AH-194-L11]|nr:NnrS family protein [Sulfurimonas sp. SAG-AH-194-L11]MDF1876536.1 NnrS family protein [Sulfurimonas sp. SAG-AH-194-L11]
MQNKTQENYFLSQPHQPFFILGVFNAIVMVLLFALSYKGVLTLTLNTTILHVYSLTYLVFTNLFLGFLFTTFPRFNQTDAITKKAYLSIFFINTIGTLLFIIGLFTSISLVIATMSMLFISHILSLVQLQIIYNRGNATDKTDSRWILLSNYFGLIAHLFFIAGVWIDPLINAAILLSFYGYLIFLSLSVAQKMIPFFSHSLISKDENFMSLLFAGFMLKIMFLYLHIVPFEIILDIVIGSYILREILRWKLKPFESPSILWVLHLALFWLPIAFLLSAIISTAELFLETSFYFLNIHLLALSFLTTLLIGFGTRVTLGHSGQAPNADRFVTNLFWFIQVVVLGRVLFSLNIAFGWGLNFLFDISFTLWLILFVLWGARYVKVLLFGLKL